jgi:hypothetical protein
LNLEITNHKSPTSPTHADRDRPRDPGGIVRQLPSLDGIMKSRAANLRFAAVYARAVAALSSAANAAVSRYS